MYFESLSSEDAEVAKRDENAKLDAQAELRDEVAAGLEAG